MVHINLPFANYEFARQSFLCTHKSHTLWSNCDTQWRHRIACACWGTRSPISSGPKSGPPIACRPPPRHSWFSRRAWPQSGSAHESCQLPAAATDAGWAHPLHSPLKIWCCSIPFVRCCLKVLINLKISGFTTEIGNRVIVIFFSITITITITLIVCNCNLLIFFILPLTLSLYCRSLDRNKKIRFSLKILTVYRLQSLSFVVYNYTFWLDG